MKYVFQTAASVSVLALLISGVTGFAAPQTKASAPTVKSETKIVSEGKFAEEKSQAANANEEKADETVVALEAAPPAVQAAIKAAAGPSGKIAKLVKENHEGGEAYEADLIVDGIEKSVKLTPSGSVIETEEELAIENIPAAIRGAVNKAVPGGTIKEALAVTEHYYEFEVEKNGKVQEVKVSLLGKAEVEEEDVVMHENEKEIEHKHDEQSSEHRSAKSNQKEDEKE